MKKKGASWASLIMQTRELFDRLENSHIDLTKASKFSLKAEGHRFKQEANPAASAGVWFVCTSCGGASLSLLSGSYKILDFLI